MAAGTMSCGPDHLPQRNDVLLALELRNERNDVLLFES